MGTAGAVCATCGTELRANAKFCDECGAPTSVSRTVAEYKQVTVLFADVVRSMGIAAAVGPERLRELMTQLANRCAAVVQRYGGTVDKFTGDGIMALFGAPTALEDHAFRACMAALDIQDEVKRLAVDVASRDGIALRLRIGLNSGQVITGAIGAGPFAYTAIGEQVGMAQRMESAAVPGGVMLGASTARLVRDSMVLGEPELAAIKGSDMPVAVFRLLGTATPRGPIGRQEVTLVGRQNEIDTLAVKLDEAIHGVGHVVGVVGDAGIGKSRLVRETVAMATKHGLEPFSTFCQAHTRQIAFHAVAGLLRAIFGVDDVVPAAAARQRLRAALPDSDVEDLQLLDDLLGIGDSEAAPLVMDPDARRRRLARLLTNATRTRTTPGLYVIEDTHWIDEASESMLTEFLSILRETPSLAMITYRPEYHGQLARRPDSDTIILAPLSDSQSSALMAALLGAHASVTELAARITERAAGNPFFAEEIVRDLAERNILEGRRGAYVCAVDSGEVAVPATVQATIAARIDRLGATAKHTLNAAAVIGSRFGADLLTKVVEPTQLSDLLDAELIEPASPAGGGEYVFLHPLIRAVAYESQLKSGRSQLHRRVAAAVQERDPETVEENAALIATHLEAAGDLREAADWNMRAAAWLTNRDIAAARARWRRARQVADRLPAEEPDRTSMRIAPRTLLCASAWRVGGSVADTGFDELQQLCTVAGDTRSLVTGMSGLLMTLTFHAELCESSRLATEYVDLLESIGDPELTVGLLHGAIIAKWQAGEMVEALRLAQRVIHLADGDPAKGNLVVGSPLAMALALRAAAASSLGQPGWQEDFDAAIEMARDFDPFSRVFTVMFKCITMLNGVLLPEAIDLRVTAEALELAEKASDDFTLANAQMARGDVLVQLDDPVERNRGFELFELVREVALQERLTICAVWSFDMAIAREKIRTGDVDGAIDLIRPIIEHEFRSGEMVYRGSATAVLVEALLRRDADGDVREAEAAIDRLAGTSTDPGFVLNELPSLRMRALLARAQGDEAGYHHLADRYRGRATSLGYQGHMATADAMA
jgi:adenylate cyclase